MAVPNATYKSPPPPPPLPPPRFIDHVTAGSDPGWAWANDPGEGNFGKARESVKSISTFPKSWDRKGEEMKPVEGPEYQRRESSSSNVRSPTDTDRIYEFARHQDEGYYSLSGPRPSAMSQQLQGERQLQQRNLESSSQAYDNKLLSKIGKPKTPPHTSAFGSLESSPTSSHSYSQSGRHPNQLRSLSFSTSSYSNSAYSDPPIKIEPSSTYGDSPRSRPVSPGLITSAGSATSFMEYRSPPQERSTPTSATDSEQYPYYPQRFPSSTNVLRQQKSRRSTSGSLLSSYDESGAGSLKNTASALSVRTSQFKRESYDHAMFSEPNSADSTFPVEDSVRQLHLEDQPPLSSKPDSLPFYYSHSHRHNQNQYQHQHQIQIRNPSLHTSRSRPGMKRKPSPPPDLSHGANAQLLAVAGMNADLYHQRNANASQHPKPRLSPGNQLGPNHRGSFSSQSSAGPHNNSYASSAPLSVGGSSITSTDQHSPGISPSSDHPQYYQQQNGQDSPYVNSFSMNSDARNTRSQQQYLQAPLEPQDTPSSDKKPQQLQTQPRPNAPNMQSPAFICACCPKRPKKFDTPEELRSHESEKQYSCAYCNNRFKNKNEAERHQNSLHLRKNSWSCATLGTSYDSAFFPTTSIPPSDSSPGQPQHSLNPLTAFDTCGYCGQQFSNEPTPNWDERGQHLINLHKYGECNQSKKFFRADHFRQHLKHSHAGTSGKWTNMLESACMREEPSPAAQDVMQHAQGAPVANMGMGQMGMGQGGVGQATMGQNVGQNIGSADMGQASLIQASMGQGGMVQGNMAQANMGQGISQADMGNIDMSNIDPNIGMQQMGVMAPMGDTGNMSAPPGRGMGMQGGQMRGERIDEMAQEM